MPKAGRYFLRNKKAVLVYNPTTTSLPYRYPRRGPLEKSSSGHVPGGQTVSRHLGTRSAPFAPERANEHAPRGWAHGRLGISAGRPALGVGQIWVRSYRTSEVPDTAVHQSEESSEPGERMCAGARNGARKPRGLPTHSPPPALAGCGVLTRRGLRISGPEARTGEVRQGSGQ